MRPLRSNSKLRACVIGLVLALTASACGTSTTTDAATSTDAATAVIETGPGLPQLVADTVSGSQLDTNDFAGQDLVVWFWAPW